MAVGGIFNFFGGWQPVPAFRNSPFRRYLSNGPCPVPQFALQPQFRPIFRIFNFGKLRYYYSNKRRYDPPLVFRFSVFWGFPGSGTARGGFYGKFQYRTTRFCGVSWLPCPENLVRKILKKKVEIRFWIFFTSIRGNFPNHNQHQHRHHYQKDVVVIFRRPPGPRFIIGQGRLPDPPAKFPSLTLLRY